jgi:hypothetical protein
MLRRFGLLLEAVSLLALLSLNRGKLDLQVFKGRDPSVVLAGGLALGFVLWLVGTVAIHWPRRGKSRSGGDE